jgi:hypothetical protein
LQAILQKTDRDLRTLPHPPSSDPVGEIHALLQGFMRDVSTHVRGVAGANGLIQRINRLHDCKLHAVMSSYVSVANPLLKDFRKAIYRTAPDFRPYERNKADPPPMPAADFLASEDPLRFEDLGNEPVYVDDVFQDMQE